jgi:type IX secretion system PorP/SprF family membrane protein
LRIALTIRFTVCIILLLICKENAAQDAAFSQFYSNPLYLNPAFTGTLAVPRINLQYRDQWHTISKAYVTQSASFDIPVERLRGGIGINFIHDAQAGNLLRSQQLNLIYSSIFRISTDLWFSGALQAGYQRNSLDWGNLVFPDNLDPYSGNHTVTAEMPFADPNMDFFDFATGVLVFGEKMFAGLAVHHLSRPEQSWYRGDDNKNTLNRRYSLHFGTRIPIHVMGFLPENLRPDASGCTYEPGKFQAVQLRSFSQPERVYSRYLVQAGIYLSL